MESLQLTMQSYEELISKPLTDSEVAAMVLTLTMFIEMLAEIDQQETELSKSKQRVKE